MSGGELRRGFHQELDEINAKVTQMYALVIESLAAATDAFLAGDHSAAQAIKQQDKVIDQLHTEIEGIVERVLLLQAPVASELRFVLTVLRIAPELERSGDLAEHIATRAMRGLGAELTPLARGLVEQLGRVGIEIWRKAADAYADRDPSAPRHLDELDDQIDELHTQLLAALENEAIPRPCALEMALIARFYERLGDHAVHITERVASVRGGAT